MIGDDTEREGIRIEGEDVKIPTSSTNAIGTSPQKNSPSSTNPSIPAASEESDTPFRIYGNAAASVINAYTSAVHQDAEILRAFFNEKTSSTVAEVQAVAAKYRILAERLATVAAPTEMQALHTTISNAYMNAAVALQTLSESSENSLSENTSTYTKGVTATNDAIIAIGLFFAEHDVRFGPSEPGSLFTLPR
jgi:hypothetical protein